jgi:D-aminopeptidase
MGTLFKNILIVSDIEGSSGCWSYEASSFKTEAWRRACVEMTRDVNEVVEVLFRAGVETITVKDFHRTGYNLLRQLIDPRARVVYGYKSGPVPGIGDPGGAEAVVFLGLHAASGTDGFLAHTLTSRIKRLEVNGKPMAEIALFAASLAPYGIRPIFFSGCAVACSQAKENIPQIHTLSIDKTDGFVRFDTNRWRLKLAQNVIVSLENDLAETYNPQGPFEAVITMRDGEKIAQKLAQRWGHRCKGANVFITTDDIHKLYLDLIRMCYLTPLIEKILPLALAISNLRGRLGMAWLRRGEVVSGK